MIVATAAAALTGLAIGYALGSPTTVEKHSTTHVKTPRMTVSGSSKTRGEATVESVEADELRMDVMGSVHAGGEVNIDEVERPE